MTDSNKIHGIINISLTRGFKLHFNKFVILGKIGKKNGANIYYLSYENRGVKIHHY